MNCTNCGAPMREGDQFCKSCGTPRASMPQPAAQAPYQDRTAQMPAQEQAAYQVPQAVRAEYADPNEQRRAEKEAQRAANAELKDAKQAYKEARANAGKSAAPKVVGVIVAVLLAAAAGAGAMWYFGGGSLPGLSSSGSSSASASADSASSEAVSGDAASASSEAAGVSSDAASASAASAASSTAASSAAASSSSASSAADDASVVAKGYIGTWKGDMTETRNTTSSTYVCYGARNNPMTLEITELESTGRLSANAKVLVHGHDMRTLDRDVDSSSGDGMVELKNLTGSFNNGSFEMKGDDADSGITVTIKVQTDDGSSSERRLVVTVSGNGARDTYTLTRTS